MTASAAVSPPRAGPFFASAVFAVAPFVVAPAASNLADLHALARAPIGAALLATAAALCGTALLAAWAHEGEIGRALRRVLLCASLGLWPWLLDQSGTSSAHALGVLQGALAGSLAGPELTEIARTVRRSTAAGEEYLFERIGLSVPALLAALATVLAIAALPPYLGGARALAFAGLLLLPWAVAAGLAASNPRRASLVAVALAAAIAAGAGVALANADRLALPLTRTAGPRVRIDALARISPQAWLWGQFLGPEPIVRVHTGEDLLAYEAMDDQRLAEALVHPAAALTAVSRALVLGNESGAVAREILRYPELQEVVHVSFHPGLTRAFQDHPGLRRAHGGALEDRRVTRLEVRRAADLPASLRRAGRFDLIVSAPASPLEAVRWLLGPSARPFFQEHLAPGGMTVRRLTSLSANPGFAWCFVEEVAEAGWYAAGYRLTLANSTLDQQLLELASPAPFAIERLKRLRAPTRYFTAAHVGKLFSFGRDQEYQREERQAQSCADELGITE